MNILKWLSGLIVNPATGQVSHTKLWANVAGFAMTWKFVQTANAPEWLWWSYGAMVGGYALAKRGMALLPQVTALRLEKERHHDMA